MNTNVLTKTEETVAASRQRRARQEPRDSKPKLFVRVIAGSASLLLVWHIVASFLWIFPPSPLRELIPAKALSGYMLPMFGQSWSVFAPEPINGDFTLDVRAVLTDEKGNEEVTEWVSATDAEFGMLTHHLFPARAALLADSVSSKHKKAWTQLSAEQKEVAALNYFKDDWQKRMSDRLQKLGATQSAINGYMGRELISTAYATQVAEAVWGEAVVRVQYRAGRQGVVPFEKRNDDEAVRPAPLVIETGWRGLVTRDGQSPERFAEIFVPLNESVKGK